MLQNNLPQVFAYSTGGPPKDKDAIHSRSLQQRFGLLTAGGIAGATAKTVVAPLERVRIMYQTGMAIPGGFLHNCRVIRDTEGLRGLWRGNYINCLRVFPSRGILFACNDKYKELFAKYFHKQSLSPDGHLTAQSMHTLPFYMSFLSGSFAGITATTLTYPMDVVRTRISGTLAAKSSYKSTNLFRILAEMAQKEGLKSWYRGVGPTLMGALPYEGIKFAVFDVLKARQPRSIEDSNILKAGYKLGSGAIAGAMSGLILYPNDTVRRLMQMQGSSNGTDIEYRNALDCWIKTFRNHGIRRFYHGLLPYMARIIPNSAITFGVFELVKPLVLHHES